MTFQRFVLAAASLAAAAVVACDPEPAPEPGAGGICSQGPHSTDGGELWPWRIRWSPQTGKTLADLCGAYGASSTVEVMIDVLDRGSLASPRVFTAPCTGGELLLELPSRSVFHGYRRLREAGTERATDWSVLVNDVHCPRDVFFVVSSD